MTTTAPKNTISDREILQQFRQDSSRNTAFRLLLQKYQQRLYWHIRRMVIDHDDADDVLQNTFVKIWENLLKFRSDAQLYTWLYRIATNETISFLNKKKSRFHISLDDAGAQLEHAFDHTPHFDGNEIELKLQRAILTLPEKQRLVFNMKYFEDMKYQDMAEVLETSVGALKASYHHAVKKIEKFLSTD